MASHELQKKVSAVGFGSGYWFQTLRGITDLFDNFYHLSLSYISVPPPHSPSVLTLNSDHTLEQAISNVHIHRRCTTESAINVIIMQIDLICKFIVL